MAQYNKTTGKFQANGQSLYDVVMVADASGSVAPSQVGIPSVARQILATITSTNTALTTTCRRVSIRASGANARFSVGTGAQTANASTSHFIAAGERLDIAVPLNANIAFIRDLLAVANASIELSELA